MHDFTQDNKDTRTFVRDIYAVFFFRSFKAPPAIWKFMRSWFHALLKPGALNPRADCGPENRYLSDVRLAEALFSLTLALLVRSFLLQDIEGSIDINENPIGGYLFTYFISVYLLWIFSSVLVGAIFSARWWLRFTKADILPRRELATLFVYEAGVLILPFVAMLFFTGFQVDIPATPALVNSGSVYVIFAFVHVFIFLFQLGTRAGFTIWKRAWTSLLLIWLFAFAWGLGVLITSPFILLPLLLPLYPLYALLRDFVPKPALVRRFFDKVQRELEV